jgi:hypothetical protein
MFNKEIEFSANENYFNLKEDFPVPIKVNIPEWFKKLDHVVMHQTIKGCMPFLDSLTAGYLLKMPQDLHIRHNVDGKNQKGENVKDSFQAYGLHDMKKDLWDMGVNLNAGFDNHKIEQLEGSPFVNKNKNLPFYKILNPWTIKTPKGYSCLFVSPLNNSDDRFSIISGIVDTDTFPREVNFPIVINGDKYPVLETKIEKGTPYVQVIPFKRDSWKMIFKSKEFKEIQNIRTLYGLQLLNKYKDKYWNKKSWK